MAEPNALFLITKPGCPICAESKKALAEAQAKPDLLDGIDVSELNIDDWPFQRIKPPIGAPAWMRVQGGRIKTFTGHMDTPVLVEWLERF